ncbi:MAG: CSLREA domain-containing protein [Chloroflexi bacterium]|nr:CSLREA domain-containing protein [Chloroflexota bacterium]
MRFLRWTGIVGVGLALSWQAAYGTLNQPQALATTITVTTLADDSVPNNGTCSLREATQAASSDLAVDACPAGSASDIIQLAAGVYRLNVSSQVSFEFGDLELNGTIQIVGVDSAATVIDANRAYRALNIVGGNVTLRNLHIRHGFMPGVEDGDPVYGHGILHQAGSLTIDSSLIRANGIITNPNNFGYDNYGGGITSMSGYLTITNSIFEENRVRDVYMGGTGTGGSLYIDTSHVSIRNSTFRGSSARGGSAIYNNSGRLVINNSHIIGQLGQGDYSAAISIGSGQLVIDNSSFTANNPSAIRIGSGSATISNSVFSSNGGGGSFYCSYGGAISSYGRLAISNSRFVDNWANEAGAIGVVTGTVTIDHSEFSENYTHITGTGRDECRGHGGAIRTGYGGKVSIDTSTFAYNEADGYAAAIYHGYNSNPLIISNSTIVSNTNRLLHPDGGNAMEDDGPGISVLSAEARLFNTILAGNRNSVTNLERDCSGTITSQGYNLIEHVDSMCNLSQTTSDQIGVDPQVAIFDVHDGFTRSFSLAADSPAIDAGPSECGQTDQRYYQRPVDGNDDNQAVCDIGAFEFGAISNVRFNSIYLPIAIK